MKNSILILFVMLFALHANAQREEPKTIKKGIQSNINIGVLGIVSPVSLNYELMLPVSNNSMLVGGVGVGYAEQFTICINPPCPEEWRVTIPHGLSYVVGKSHHKVEFGFQGTVASEAYIYSPLLAYRFLPENPKKVNLRFLVSYPHWGEGVYDYVFLPVAFHVGKTF